MKQHPILFSTPMVQAILEGRKTQTRRIIKESFNGCLTNGGPHPCPNAPNVFYPGERLPGWLPGDPELTFGHENVIASFHCSTLNVDAVCKFGKKGDILWVRETWCDYNDGFSEEHKHLRAPEPWYLYRASSEDFQGARIWKPSIHMPKSACRIYLEITDIRVERLQDISEEDAKAEGVERYNDGMFKFYMDPAPATVRPGCDKAKLSFQTLWETINGEESWEINPWVWVISFKRINQASLATSKEETNTKK